MTRNWLFDVLASKQSPTTRLSTTRDAKRKLQMIVMRRGISQTLFKMLAGARATCSFAPAALI